MRFGAFALGDAEGLILAHSIRLPGQALKKGRVLDADDLDTLRAAGIESVTGARLEADDVAEDAAALAVARNIVGAGVSLGKAFTGRCNIYAEQRGLAVIDAARIDRINRVDEAMTVGTIRPYELIEPGKMVATVKVIPFAAPREVVERCVAIADEDGPILRVAALVAPRVGLIQTRLPGTRERVLDSTTGAVITRLSTLDTTLAAEIRCNHAEREVADAIEQLLARGSDLILIAGASAIVDRRDVIPAGIVEAGGAIDHFGMPVDPGNLLLLAHHDDTPVLGLPGCARSLKLNGFDWVLQRLCAGLPVTGADIMGMGAGGLLMEIPSRPLPRADASPKAPKGGAAKTKARKNASAKTQARGETQDQAAAPRIGAIVLAAGQSRRMGRMNKLLAEVDGTPMVTRVVNAALTSRANPVVVVTGHEAEGVKAALAGAPVVFVHNPDFAEGMSGSVRHGIEALPADLDGVVICLGDMPRTNASVIDRLIEDFNPLEGRAIGVPTHRGKRGNPVLWAARYFEEMRGLAGDVGARHLIGAHAEAVYEIESPDQSVTIDVDTPDALDALAAAR